MALKGLTEIPIGFCQCGCGGKTKIAKYDCKTKGHVKGKPLKYLHNHQAKMGGNNHPNWKGGRRIDKNGYILVYQPHHPRVSNGYVREHILVAEEALGEPLPLKAEVHHVNGDKGDNSRGNLVICQDDAYHKLLEQRTRAYRACGHVSWRKCCICKKYGEPTNLIIRGNRVFHPQCQSDYNRRWRSANPGYHNKYRKRIRMQKEV